MSTPLIAPPEAQSSAPNGKGITTARPSETPASVTLSRPFRLGLVGVGAAVGLFVRLLAANKYGDINSRSTMIGAAVTSGLMGLGLLLMASERDRFGSTLAWISAITALAWGALNWLSPPFASSVTIWSQPDQAVLAVVGLGNGLLLAGIVALGFVRRHPTLTISATLLGSVFALVANTVLLRNEWPAIISLGVSFVLILLAWNRSPQRELTYAIPETSPRASRAALSFISLALSGTAIQLWTSRTDIPRSNPAVIVCGLVVLSAFATLRGVQREIENRETTLREWTAWAREVRTNRFHTEMQNFGSEAAAPSDDEPEPHVNVDGQTPRTLLFPNLLVPDDQLAPTAAIASDVVSVVMDTPDTIPATKAMATSGLHLIPDVAPAATTTTVAIGPSELMVHATTGADAASGAFASAAIDPGHTTQLATLETLGAWLSSPAATARAQPLLVAIEAMSLDQFESLPPADATMATEEIGSFLADIMPDADLVARIDGPYFIVAYASKPDHDLSALNKSVRMRLKGTDGMVAFLRPGPDAILDDMVDEAVTGLLRARRAQERATGR